MHAPPAPLLARSDRERGRRVRDPFTVAGGTSPALSRVSGMKILTRYVIRAHIGPFLFAFIALTGLIFLNAVANRLEDLAGKGLGLAVIGEFIVLSLPHVVALTFPMSILVATLYAFSQLMENNEVAAVAAGGIHPLRLILPLIGVGAVLVGATYGFNDRILPESNRRLSSLLTDIGSKSPTFELREEVINEIDTDDDSRYFLRSSSIDPQTNELIEVTIFDMSEAGQLRTITAERGHMAFTPGLRDLVLTLEDGVIFEVTDDRPGLFQRLNYESQVLPLRGVVQEFERQSREGNRSDREMTVEMLRGEVEASAAQMRRIEEANLATAREAVEIVLGQSSEEARSVASGTGGETPVEVEREGAPLTPLTLASSAASELRIHRARWDVFRLAAARDLVEIHKKYAIAIACIIFVLLGPPLAMRFPQGGPGMVIAASVLIFCLYWTGLIGGERFADEGVVDPIVAMWASNAVLLSLALMLLWNVGNRISTNRGNAWAELRARVGATLNRLPRPRGRA